MAKKRLQKACLYTFRGSQHSFLSFQVSQPVRFADPLPEMQEGPQETDIHCGSIVDTTSRDTRAGSTATNTQSSEGIVAANGTSTVDS